VITATAEALYLHVVGYPSDGVIRVRGLDKRAKGVTVLDSEQPLEFDQHSGKLEQGLLRIFVPGASLEAYITVIKITIAE
jgi:hypothetical protein